MGDVDRVWQQLKAASVRGPTRHSPTVCCFRNQHDPPLACPIEQLVDTVLHHKSSAAREEACNHLAEHVARGNQIPAQTVACLADRIAHPSDEDELAAQLRLIAVLPPQSVPVSFATTRQLDHSSPAVVEAG